ncbi:MAG: hypothetical protein KKB20_29000 [Proteobacteria bacterium]|nr:hypothetical protein [Pseudomonadota bacterium]
MGLVRSRGLEDIEVYRYDPADDLFRRRYLADLAWFEAVHIFEEQGFPVLLDPRRGVLWGEAVLEYLRAGEFPGRASQE